MEDSPVCAENSCPGGLGIWVIVLWEEWVRHHRLFAAGLAAALMLGAAAPALADPGKSKGKGKAEAPGQTKQKPNKPAPKPKKAKKTKSGVSGGGGVNGAEFSIQARLRDIHEPSTSTSKGHFNYTDATTKIRCRGFEKFVPDLVAGTAAVPFKNCTVTGQPTVTTITVTVTDKGQPKYEALPPVADHITFVAGTLTVDLDLTGGNVKVR
jgi:hypothetical protein